MAEAGRDPHGEVAFVERLLARHDRDGSTTTVLDAGCGTGRVAIELANRGFTAQGTDVDAAMLYHAASKRPDLTWHLGNLADIDLPTIFGLVVMAGNVILFVDAAERERVLQNISAHIERDGLFVAGFQLKRGDDRHVTLVQWDAWAAAAGLLLVERYATWDDDRWTPDSDYAVSVHRQ